MEFETSLSRTQIGRTFQSPRLSPQSSILCRQHTASSRRAETGAAAQSGLIRSRRHRVGHRRRWAWTRSHRTSGFSICRTKSGATRRDRRFRSVPASRLFSHRDRDLLRWGIPFAIVGFDDRSAMSRERYRSSGDAPLSWSIGRLTALLASSPTDRGSYSGRVFATSTRGSSGRRGATSCTTRFLSSPNSHRILRKHSGRRPIDHRDEFPATRRSGKGPSCGLKLPRRSTASHPRR